MNGAWRQTACLNLCISGRLFSKMAAWSEGQRLWNSGINWRQDLDLELMISSKWAAVEIVRGEPWRVTRRRSLSTCLSMSSCLQVQTRVIISDNLAMKSRSISTGSKDSTMSEPEPEECAPTLPVSSSTIIPSSVSASNFVGEPLGIFTSLDFFDFSDFSEMLRPWNRRTRSSSERIQLGRIPAPMHFWYRQYWQFLRVIKLIWQSSLPFVHLNVSLYLKCVSNYFMFTVNFVIGGFHLKLKRKETSLKLDQIFRSFLLKIQNKYTLSMKNWPG